MEFDKIEAFKQIEKQKIELEKVLLYL